MSAVDVIRELALAPHPEGGWYREVYRSSQRVASEQGNRSSLTTIYYLLEREQLSRWHMVRADEVWHFYAGAPLELLAYDPEPRRLTRHVLGTPDPSNSAGATSPGSPRPAPRDSVPRTSKAVPEPVAVIPSGVWQAARSLGEYSLVGCTVGPGFEFEDFRFVADIPGHQGHFDGDLAAFTHLL